MKTRTINNGLTVVTFDENGAFGMFIPAWGIEAETGYKPVTTFWRDLSIAENFSGKEIQETLRRCIDYAKEQGKEFYKCMTELALVLNHKIWQHYDRRDNARSQILSRIYDSLWRKVDEWCCENLKGDELSYYYRTTD